MPIYNYKCRSCDEEFELLVGVTYEKAELKCTGCGSKEIEKQLSLFSTLSSSIRKEPQNCSPEACNGCMQNQGGCPGGFAV